MSQTCKRVPPHERSQAKVPLALRRSNRVVVEPVNITTKSGVKIRTTCACLYTKTMLPPGVIFLEGLDDESLRRLKTRYQEALDLHPASLVSVVSTIRTWENPATHIREIMSLLEATVDEDLDALEDHMASQFMESAREELPKVMRFLHAVMVVRGLATWCVSPARNIKVRVMYQNQLWPVSLGLHQSGGWVAWVDGSKQDVMRILLCLEDTEIKAEAWDAMIQDVIAAHGRVIEAMLNTQED